MCYEPFKSRHDFLPFGLTSSSNEVEETANSDITGTPLSQQNTSTTEQKERPELLLSLEDKQKKRIEELEARVKRAEEKGAEAYKRSAVAEEKAKNVSKKLERLEEAVNCVVCLDVLRSAHSLECGHSACYECLRAWWTILDDEDIIAPMTLPTEGTSNPSTRHPLQSVVNRQKLCPQCRRRITRQPAPNYVVRDIVEIMNDRLPIRPPQYDDPWDGIFHSQTYDAFVHPEVYSNPINEENMSVAVYRGVSLLTRRAAGAALARRQLELDQARENSQRMVMVLERMLQERAENAARSRPSEPEGELGSLGGMAITIPDPAPPPDITPTIFVESASPSFPPSSPTHPL